MTSPPPGSVDGTYPSSSHPHPTQNHQERGYSSSFPNSRVPYLTGGSAVTDFGSTIGKPMEFSPVSQSAAQQPSRFNEEWDASQRGSSIIDSPAMQRTN